jgi:hypothetical protein
MISGILQHNSHFRMIDRSGKMKEKKSREKKSSLSLNKCMISKEIMKHINDNSAGSLKHPLYLVHIINHG